MALFDHYIRFTIAEILALKSESFGQYITHFILSHVRKYIILKNILYKHHSLLIDIL